VKPINLLFCCFCALMKNAIIAKNGRKVEAIALLFAVLWPLMKNGKRR
jgi:hypothetical protein